MSFAIILCSTYSFICVKWVPRFAPALRNVPQQIISSEEETTKKNGLQDAKFGGLNGGYPGSGGYQGGGGYPGNGEYQGGSKYLGNGGGYQGGGGHDGGARGGGGRGGGYRCRHNCCDRGRYYRCDCYNCCYSAAQAKAFAAETTTTVIYYQSLKI
ncbi:hypothetical protein MKX01_037357 [Papaver californicum]|nr:hypothetical protein MKX01_037357 [Papaver californicum]